MRKITILFALLTFSLIATAQLSPGVLKVENLGTHYRIGLDPAQMPYNKIAPRPDSMSLRISVMCLQTYAEQVNNLPITGKVEYRMGGSHLIGVTVIWWRNGVKKSQTSIPTTCWFFTNPLQCFERI